MDLNQTKTDKLSPNIQSIRTYDLSGNLSYTEEQVLGTLANKRALWKFQTSLAEAITLSGS